MKKQIQSLILATSLILAAGLSEAKVVRATELDERFWSNVQKGESTDTVEFRRGDELPVSLSTEGDFFEMAVATPNVVRIKRDFWLRADRQNLFVSLDGVEFRKLGDVAGGSLSLSAGDEGHGGVAQAIRVSLKAILKP